MNVTGKLHTIISFGWKLQSLIIIRHIVSLWLYWWSITIYFEESWQLSWHQANDESIEWSIYTATYINMLYTKKSYSSIKTSHCNSFEDLAFIDWFHRHASLNLKRVVVTWQGRLGAVSIRKTVLPGMAIPMLKIRRPNGRLIFNMEIAIRR